MAGFSTLIDMLRMRAERMPDRHAFTFLREGVHEEARYTYAGLDRAARAIAAALQQGASPLLPGERALLIYPPGLEFLAAFFGCLYAGAVPIPAPAPDAARFKRTFPRLRGIIDDAGARLILSTASIRDNAAAVGEDGMPWLCSDQVDLDLADGWRPVEVAPHDLAYLQYTSGSTSRPKGVMLSHASVLRNLDISKAGWGYTGDSVAVTWMPYFHDYGLVDGLLQPVYSGIPCYVMSPLTFVKRPQRWLEAISRYRATHTQAPNFAYELCLYKVTPEQRDALDLRCLRVASNGAEPVREATFTRFVDYFGPCGFQPQAFYPSYGLAEATLLVSTKRHGVAMGAVQADAAMLERERRFVPAQAGALARSIASCGPALPGLRIAIVDAESQRRLPDGAVGEVWVCDPCVADGYWARPDESKEIFAARIAGEGDACKYLRTGDLGFLHQDELYVAGRLKDLIIIAGVNHYPQDVEWTVQQCHPEIRPEHCAAFSVEQDGAEGLVVVAEFNRELDDWQPVFEAARRAVSEGHEAELHAFVALKKGGIHKTSSGKLQRSKCRAAFLEGSLSAFAEWRKASAAPASKDTAPAFKREQLVDWLVQALAARLDIAAARIDLDAPFNSYGLSSRLGVELVGDLEQWLGRDDLSPTLLWEYPTVAALSAHLSGTDAAAPAAHTVPPRAVAGDGPIAIVGMACRLPGAANPEQFWQMLSTKGEGIVTLPAGRWEGAGVAIAAGIEPGNVTTLRGGFVDQVDRFDARLFGISAREAEIMDPQQRMLLEVAWEAVERAGMCIDELAGSDTGVFVGISTDDYSAWQMGDPARISAYTGPAKALSIAANRISYQFDFQGPSMAIDTACSSSLVAIHQASQALRRGECGMAIAGGVNLILAPHMSIALSQAGMLSPDGRCKTFDAAADGYVRGEGCVLLVLKRLEDALRDGDTVTAVIRGSAVNQDGRSNGLTAPNGLAQQRVLGAALAAAGVQGADIDYVEAHGTGTALGDPIEVKSLQAVLTPGRAAERPLMLGSVKTNVGHLEAAAGAAGVLKTALCLARGEIAPHPTLTQLNPLLDPSLGAFSVPTEATAWPAGQRLAGVSSFGFGGTNAHVVLQAPPEAPIVPAARHAERPLQLLTLNANDREALRALAQRWVEHCHASDAELGELCFSANAARARLPERLAVTGADRAAIQAALQDWLADRPSACQAGRSDARRAPRIGFLFTGQGAQYFGMGRELYETERAFKQDIDACDAVLREAIGHSLVELLYGADDGCGDERLAQTEITQPTLFAIEYALARLWMSWGIAPHAMLGHSVGEFAAACVAGVFSLEDGLKLIAARARAMHHAPGDGAMVAVTADEAQCRAAIAGMEDKVVIGVYNGARNHVLSGERTALDEAVARLTVQGVEVRPLKVSHAFHSPLMEAAREQFAAAAAAVRYRAPSMPIFSNLSGGQAGAELATADYWVRHLLQPVRFAQGLQAMRDFGIDVFIEIGPRPTLVALGQQSIEDGELLWLASLRPKVSDSRQMQEGLGALHVRGAHIDWRGVHRHWPRRRVAVPTYPFQGRRYWLPPVSGRAAAAAVPFPGTKIASPLLDHILFENRYDAKDFALLAEHLVFGQIVVPAAAHLSLAVEAAASVLGDVPCAVQDAVFTQALVVPQPGARRVQLALAKQTGEAVGEGRVFRLISMADDDEDNWQEHASGRIATADAAPATTGLDSIRERCGATVSADFYRDIWQPAIALGGQFRWVKQVWRGGQGEVLARLEMPAEAGGAGYRLHPGMLDSMLQVLTAAVPVADGEALVPFNVDAFRWLAKATGKEFWSHLQVREAGAGDEIQSDVALYDAEGRKVAEAIGFRARRLASRHLMPARADLDEAVYALRWEQTDIAPSAIEGKWLVLGADTAAAERLARAIGQRANNPEHGIALAANLDDAEQLLALLRAQGPIQGVAYLADLADGGAASSLDAAVAASARVLHLVQSLLALGEVAPRLVLVTRDATSGAARADQAAIHGLARVARLEHPELACLCIDTDGTASEDNIAALLGAAQPDLALRGASTLAPLLERRKLGAPAAATIRADASYVISGGLGALGLHLAEWLAAQGARHLVLLGRREPSAAAAARIAVLREQGVLVHIGAIDVGAEDAVSALSELFADAAIPAPAGVFHLAGVLDDGMLRQQNAARIARVLQPKLGGALNLQRAFESYRLDHFVCYSSVAALTGSMGQGTYAAANAALDALMAARRAQGLAGASIQWGPWAESGMAAEQAERDRQRFADYGIDPIEPAAGMALFPRLLAANSAASDGTLAVLPVQWPTYLKQLYAAQFPPMYRDLAGVPAVPQSQPASGLAERLGALPAPERRALLEKQLQETIGAVIGMGGKPIGARQRLFDIGLDSLGAVELRNRLAAALGRSMRATLLFDYPTLEALLEHIERDVLGFKAEQAEEAAVAPIENLDQLSDDELARLLAAELG